MACAGPFLTLKVWNNPSIHGELCQQDEIGRRMLSGTWWIENGGAEIETQLVFGDLDDQCMFLNTISRVGG